MTSDARVERERNIVGWIRVTPSSVTERARASGRRCARAAWREDDDALGVYGGDDGTNASGRGAGKGCERRGCVRERSYRCVDVDRARGRSVGGRERRIHACMHSRLNRRLFARD